jgi:dihydrofolate reductase/thymidylate synthase
MGRKTWESIPSKFRPLSERINVVLSRNSNIREELGLPPSVMVASSLDSALQQLSSAEIGLQLGVDKVFVIGGEDVYREAVQSQYCESVHLTSVEADIKELDTYFPALSACRWRLVSRSAPMVENGLQFRFTCYDRVPDDLVLEGDAMAVGGSSSSSSSSSPPAPPTSSPDCGNPEEMQYLGLVREIIDHGVLRGDRTGTGTLSKFGVQMRFSLRQGVFPLLTTKKVFWRGVAEELLWFVKGCTNAKELSDKGIHIWDGNGSREFLDKNGLGHREEGDLGPVYGFQWRHFGAEYKNMHTDYSGQGVDQLKQCVERIKSTPEDRRIVLTAWNPADLSKMALPPCHMFCQFYVSNGELSCQMYQRSADMGLGVPFNIASYALLTVMMAQVCGLRAGDFVHSIGDAHVYVNHVDALREQLKRSPRPFPRLLINPAVKDIDGFKYDDFTVEGYQPDAAVKMQMAV